MMLKVVLDAYDNENVVLVSSKRNVRFCWLIEKTIVIVIVLNYFAEAAIVFRSSSFWNVFGERYIVWIFESFLNRNK